MFLDSTFIWTEVFSCFSFPPEAITTRYTIGSVPVTFNEKIYYEVLSSEKQTGNDFEGTGKFIRTDDANHVFILYGGEEQLIYDFNLEINDTIVLDQERGLIVVEIDTVLLENGEPRKRWLFQCFHEATPYNYWIEGIGDPNGLLDYSYACYIDGCGTSVLCMSKNDTLLFDNPYYDTCWYFVSDATEIIHTGVSISPNPTTGYMSISAPDLIIKSIYIFDLQGNIIYKGNSLTIETLHFPPGCYIIAIELKNGKWLRKKFIKL